MQQHLIIEHNMKKAGLKKYSEEWYENGEKVSVITGVIAQSLSLEAMQLCTL